MPGGNRKLSDKRCTGRIEDDAGYFGSADRVWPITGDHLLSKLPGRAHAIGQGVYERVDASAHILQVNDDYVHVAQHVFGWLARLAVQRIDWHAGFPVDGV